MKDRNKKEHSYGWGRFVKKKDMDSDKEVFDFKTKEEIFVEKNDVDSDSGC